MGALTLALCCDISDKSSGELLGMTPKAHSTDNSNNNHDDNNLLIVAVMMAMTITTDCCCDGDYDYYYILVVFIIAFTHYSQLDLWEVGPTILLLPCRLVLLPAGSAQPPRVRPKPGPGRRPKG